MIRCIALDAAEVAHEHRRVVDLRLEDAGRQDTVVVQPLHGLDDRTLSAARHFLIHVEDLLRRRTLFAFAELFRIAEDEVAHVVEHHLGTGIRHQHEFFRPVFEFLLDHEAHDHLVAVVDAAPADEPVEHRTLVDRLGHRLYEDVPGLGRKARILFILFPDEFQHFRYVERLVDENFRIGAVVIQVDHRVMDGIHIDALAVVSVAAFFLRVQISVSTVDLARCGRGAAAHDSAGLCRGVLHTLQSLCFCVVDFLHSILSFPPRGAALRRTFCSAFALDCIHRHCI